MVSNEPSDWKFNASPLVLKLGYSYKILLYPFQLLHRRGYWTVTSLVFSKAAWILSAVDFSTAEKLLFHMLTAGSICNFFELTEWESNPC